VRELFDKFIREKRFLADASLNTIRSYEMSFLKFEKYTERLDKASLNEFVIGMRQEGLKPGGCNVKIRSINSFLSWCYENGHTDQHLKIKQIKTGQSVLKIFTEAHISAILRYKPKDKYQHRFYAVTCLLIDTGMRIDEALSLKLADVDFEQLLVKVRGKGDKERIAPISMEGRKILYRYLKERVSSEFLFSSRSGLPLMYRNYIRQLRDTCKEMGISGVRISPHNFRHYFAIQYLRNGGDIYRLSRILGHTTVSTTTVYLRSMGVDIIREAHQSPLSRIK
jgi:integrase/recombinase XerD